MDYIYTSKADGKNSLSHKGQKGMKWGYTDGKRNGKRTAGVETEVGSLGEWLKEHPDWLSGTDRTIYELLSYKPKNKSVSDFVKDILGYDEQKKYNSAKNWADLEKELYESYTKKINEVEKDMLSDGALSDLEKSQLKAFNEWPAYALENYKKWEPVVEQTLSDYSKTPLYKIEKAKETVNKGIEAVKRFFGK